jgi:hypothetical protein
MPCVGGLVNRSGEAVRADEGEVDVVRVDKTIYKTWVEGLVSSLQLAWEVTHSWVVGNPGNLPPDQANF